MTWLRAHWEIKLIALMLSVVLFLYTNEQVRDDLSASVIIDRESLVDLPPDFLVTDISPQLIGVDLNGPLTLLEDVDVKGLQARLPFAEDRLDADSLQLTYDLTPELLQLGPDIRLRSMTNSRITVSLDRVITRTLICAVAVGDIDVDQDGVVVVEAK